MSDMLDEYFRILRSLGPDETLLKRIEQAEVDRAEERAQR